MKIVYGKNNLELLIDNGKIISSVNSITDNTTITIQAAAKSGAPLIVSLPNSGNMEQNITHASICAAMAGFTGILLLLPNLLAAKEMADLGRSLNNKLATNVGIMLPLAEVKSMEQIKELESVPLTLSWYLNSSDISSLDFALLTNTKLPIYLAVENRETMLALSSFFKATKVAGIAVIANLLFEIAEDADFSNLSHAHIYSNIKANVFQVMQQAKFKDLVAGNIKLLFDEINANSIYRSFNIVGLGYLQAGFNADIVFYDKYSYYVIVGGNIVTWQSEFCENFMGLAYKRL